MRDGDSKARPVFPLYCVFHNKWHQHVPGGSGAGAHHPTSHIRQSPRAGVGGWMGLDAASDAVFMPQPE